MLIKGKASKTFEERLKEMEPLGWGRDMGRKGDLKFSSWGGYYSGDGNKNIFLNDKKDRVQKACLVLYLLRDEKF